MDEKKLYSVKEVIAICNISRGWLYYYEDRGLIHSVRHSINNYRYYDEEQIFRIDMIKECLELGFDFESIKKLLEDSSSKTLRRAVHQAMEGLREEMRIAQKKFIHSMERMNNMLEATYIIDANVDQSVSINIVQVPEANIVFTEQDLDFFDYTIEYRKQFSKLDRIIGEFRYTKLSPHLYGFYGHFDPYSGVFDRKPHKVRAFYRIAEKVPNKSNHMYVPAYNAISMIHIGDYGDELEKSYQKLIEYARKEGIKIKAESYEEQMLNTAFSYNSNNNLTTKIYIPIDE